MSIIGTWKVKKLFTFVPEEGMKSITVEEAIALNDPELLQMAAAILKIDASGQMQMCMAIPEEMLAQAKAEGAPLTEDGMVIMEAHEWKEEDGKFFYHSGNEGTIGDEAISPWEPLETDEEGLLCMMGGMLRFGKA